MAKKKATTKAPAKEPEKTPVEAPAQANGTKKPPKDTRKKILLVDDDPDFLFQHKARLEEAGYAVVTAENENQAETILAKERFDGAIIDPMLTHADGGFILCYKIKKKTPGTPIVLVSSMNDTMGMSFSVASEEDREWIRADAFLSKPIRFEQLLGELEKLM